MGAQYDPNDVGYELIILRICGDPIQVIVVVPDTDIGWIKLFAEEATNIPSEHQRYLGPATLPGEPVILDDWVTLRLFGSPPTLTMVVDTHSHNGILPFRRPRDDALSEYELYKNGLVFGLDGSFIDEDAMVWVVRSDEFPDAVTGVRQIDYFHGCIEGTPIAQMQMMDGEDFYSTEMFSATNGHVARCITKLQRSWRERRAREIAAARVRIVVRLQTLWRGRRAREIAAAKVRIVMKLQRLWREQRERRNPQQSQIMLDEVVPILMEKFGTTLTTGAQNDSIDMHAEVYRRRQVMGQGQDAHEETEAEDMESREPLFELFPEDGYELTIIKMCGKPIQVVDVRPDTEIREVKLLLEHASGIPSGHQRYLWVYDEDGDEYAGVLPGEPVVLDESVTMGKLGNPPVLVMIIDVKRCGKLPFRRPCDDGLCERELMDYGIMCGLDGSSIHNKSLVWVVRSNWWADSSTGMKRIDYFHSDEDGVPIASMLTRREEDFEPMK